MVLGVVLLSPLLPLLSKAYKAWSLWVCCLARRAGVPACLQVAGVAYKPSAVFVSLPAGVLFARESLGWSGDSSLKV